MDNHGLVAFSGASACTLCVNFSRRVNVTGEGPVARLWECMTCSGQSAVSIKNHMSLKTDLLSNLTKNNCYREIQKRLDLEMEGLQADSSPCLRLRGDQLYSGLIYSSTKYAYQTVTRADTSVGGIRPWQ